MNKNYEACNYNPHIELYTTIPRISTKKYE